MKFKIKRNLLINALNFSSSPIINSSDSGLAPYVKNVYLEVFKDKLVFNGTNSDVLFCYQINSDGENCIIEEKGNCLLYGKTFLSIVKKYSGDEFVSFSLSLNDQQSEGESDVAGFLEIKYKKSTQRIACEPNFHYPKDKLVISTPVNEFKISSQVLLSSLDNVLFACGNDPHRPDLRNICVEFLDDKVYFIGTSGPNVSVYSIPNISVAGSNTNNSFLLRKDILTLDNKLFNLNNSTAIVTGKNKMGNDIVSIQHDTGSGRIDVYAKPIDRPFSNWKIIYEAKNLGEVVSLPRREFLEVLDRLTLISPSLFILYAKNEDEVDLFASSTNKSTTDISDFQETIKPNNLFQKYMISLNTTLLRDNVKHMVGDEIIISMIEVDAGNGDLIKLIKCHNNFMENYDFFLCIAEDEEDEEESIDDEVEVDDGEVPF